MPGPVRAVAASVAAGALAGSVVLSLLRLLHPDSFWFVLITGYVPYALLGYPVAAALLLALRRTTGVPLRGWLDGAIALALAGTLFHGVLLAPAYLGDHPSGPASLTVVTLNLRLGHGDAEAAVSLLRHQTAQVAVLEEVTLGERGRLVAAGIGQTLPYSAGTPGPGASGTMVFSAYPLSDSLEVPLHHDSYRVRVAAPEPFWLVGVHVAQPINAPADWRADWSVLDQVVPDLDGTVVVAGDFNTTLDHGTMRDLLGHGFRDAARESNAGWQPTWPHGLGLLAIDHVLVRGAYGAVSTETVRVPGTDHRGLVARFAVR